MAPLYVNCSAGNTWPKNSKNDDSYFEKVADTEGVAHYHPARIARVRERKETAAIAERLLWSRLQLARHQGLRFRRRLPIDGYLVDFFCPEAKVVVELVEGRSDGALERLLEQKGYFVLTCDVDSVNSDPSAAASGILEYCMIGVH